MTTSDDEYNIYTDPVVNHILDLSHVDIENSRVEDMYRKYAEILYYEPASQYMTIEWIASMLHDLYWSVANSYGG